MTSKRPVKCVLALSVYGVQLCVHATCTLTLSLYFRIIQFRTTIHALAHTFSHSHKHPNVLACSLACLFAYYVFISQDRKHLSILPGTVEHVQDTTTTTAAAASGNNVQCKTIFDRFVNVWNWTSSAFSQSLCQKTYMLYYVCTISIVALKWNNNRKMLRLRHCRCRSLHATIVAVHCCALVICHFEKFLRPIKINDSYESVSVLLHTCTLYNFVVCAACTILIVHRTI